ncbi:MAG: hypothetical protein ABIZ81_16950 [Opitutaceae bacterium]
MRRTVFFCCIAVVTGTIVRSSPVDSAILAAMNLREAGNYQWTSTVEDDGRFYVIEGKTRKDGYTLVNMPMVGSIQRKIGGSGADMQRAVFKGDMDFVVETPDGWKTQAELAAVAVAPRRGSHAGARRRPASAGGGGAIGPGHPAFRYSNLQLNLSHPHDELGIIVGSYSEIRPDAAGACGTLSEQGAKLLLVHPGQNEITPLRASGTFKLWLKDGVLVRYEVQLAGTISVGVGSNRWEISLRQTTTTEVKAVGTTPFEVPEEAKRKLD